MRRAINEKMSEAAGCSQLQTWRRGEGLWTDMKITLGAGRHRHYMSSTWAWWWVTSSLRLIAPRRISGERQAEEMEGRGMIT